MRETRTEKAISDGGGGAMARNFAIVKGLIDLRKLAEEKKLLCETCVGTRARATGIAYIGKKFIHRCGPCTERGRTARNGADVTVAPIPSRTSAPDFARDRAKIAAAVRGEFINSAPAPVRPQRPHPAGDSANYRTPKIVPTRWLETPDDRP